MLVVLKIITVIVLSVAVALALAHALELPGKMRLTKEMYYAVQPIYYPGFTLGGISEPVSLLLTIVLLFLAPRGSANFWLTLVALLGLVGMQAVYWLVTHPVNKFWVEGTDLNQLGSSFFSFGVENNTASPEWTTLRNRWEYSHVARAIFALTSLVALVIATAYRT
jgi:Domain of unknown function (DUF1772)